MSHYPVFLSVVVVVRNQEHDIVSFLENTGRQLQTLVSDYEIVVVDNGSEDNTLNILKDLTGENGLPNIQVYALTREVGPDTSAWAGVENALGDYVAVLDPYLDDTQFLSSMLEQAVEGSDVVFAKNTHKLSRNLMYRMAYGIFSQIYYWFNGVHLAKEAPYFRIINRKVLNYILQFRQPASTYRFLPAIGGFSKKRLEYNKKPLLERPKKLGLGIDRAMRMLVSSTQTPMRVVTTLSLFGAFANVLYSIYVILIVLFKKDVAEGWVSLSLQQSGMFFLISLVLLVLGEYILHMVRLSDEGPSYHVAQEMTSARMTRKEKLNIEEAELSSAHNVQEAG